MCKSKDLADEIIQEISIDGPFSFCLVATMSTVTLITQLNLSWQLRKYDEVVQLCELSLASAERNHAAVSVESSTYPQPQGSQTQLGGYALKVWRWQLNARAKFHLGRLEEALELLQKLDEVASFHKYVNTFCSCVFTL